MNTPQFITEIDLGLEEDIADAQLITDEDREKIAEIRCRVGVNSAIQMGAVFADRQPRGAPTFSSVGREVS